MTTVADSVQELSTTIGTSSFVLGGVIAGGAYRTFGSKHAANEKVRYRAEKGAQWEVGLGTLVDSTHLSRDYIISSSSNDQLVDFLDGTMTVSEALTSYDIMRFAGLENDIITTIADLTKVNMFLEDGSAKPKRMTVANFLTLFGTTPAQMTALANLSKLIGVDSNGNLGTVSQSLGQSFLGTTGGGADTTPPTFVSAQIANSTPSVIQVTMSETLGSTPPPVSSVSVTKNGSAVTVNSITTSGSVMLVTVASPFANGNTCSLTYTKPTNGAMLTDAAATPNAAATFTAANVTNNVGVVDNIAPTQVSAAVANATPTKVTITMSEALDATYVPAASAFTVSGHTVSAAQVSGSTIVLTVDTFVNGETQKTVGYTQPGTNNARDLAGNLLANFSGLAITNNVAAAGSTMDSKYSLYNTSGAGQTYGVKYPTPGSISASGYYDGSVGLYIRSATGVAALATEVIMMAWSKRDAAGNPVKPDLSTYTKNGQKLAPSRTGGWTDSDTPATNAYYGLYGNGGTSMFIWGSPGTYDLWMFYSDGTAEPFDNGTGTPVGLVLS